MDFNLSSVFLQIIQPETLIILIAGVALGIIIGAIPGLTPTMGVALFVPFTFKMSPAIGLIFLGAIYSGSVYGGSISAILLNVPGAPASIATLFDGNPMARKGEGEKALYISVLCAGLGGIFGILLLLLFAPPLAAFSLKFGPSECFWMAMFGITIIASLSDKSVVKGLISGLIGLFLSTIGLSTISGTQRFTFGIPELVGGITLIAALIGMFALSQCLTYIEELYSDTSDKRTIYQKSKGSFIEAIKSIKNSKFALMLGSVIGAIVGIVPGAGGQVASLMAYNEVKRYSKDRDKFGTGHPEGLVASECSHNAMVGGSLIPLLTLGIPGSPTAAVLLGGLLIHGLWPGPELFTTYADISYTFIFGLLVAQVVMVILGSFGGKYFAKVLMVPQQYLVPAIISLCIIGSFATQNSYSDSVMMVVLGVSMFVMMKVGLSAAPLILGLILGSYAEEGFLLSIRAGEAGGSVASLLFLRPISMVLIALCLISIGSTIWFQTRKKKNTEEEVCPVEEVSSNLKSIHKLPVDRLVTIGFVVLSAILLFMTKDFPTEVALFPRVIIIGIIILSIINLFMPKKNEVSGSYFLDANLIKWFILILVTTFVYLYAIPVVGFYTVTFLYMLLLPGVFRSKLVSFKHMKVRDLLIAFFYCVILYGIFTVFLSVPTPTGLLI